MAQVLTSVAARALAICLILLVAACGARIVPLFDEDVVAGLNRANEQTLVLFSSLSAGARKAEFGAYAAKYDAVIGAFEAVKNRASARVVPPLPAYLAKAKLTGEICGDDDTTTCLNSSPRFIGRILDILTQMRESHRTGDVDRAEVKIYKATYAVSIHQALTVETALRP